MSVPPHPWRECRPVVLDLKGNDIDVARASAALAGAWSLVPSRDRKLFHDFCCLNIHDDNTHAAIRRIGALVRLALDGGLRRLQSRI